MKTALWTPSDERVDAANITRFRGYINERFELSLGDYDALWQWSIDHRAELWEAIWDFCGVVSSRRGDEVGGDLDRMPGSRWFVGSRLNFAENLLRYRDDRPALVFQGEQGEPVTVTYAELYDEVARVAAALRAEGVGVGRGRKLLWSRSVGSPSPPSLNLPDPP